MGIVETPSFEPIFKGISFGDHHLVTVSADGVWFHKFSIQNGNKFEITKGIFGVFPKTSMTCLTKISNQFIVTGGVDGYIFVWSNDYECRRAHKITVYPILSILVNSKNLFVGDS